MGTDSFVYKIKIEDFERHCKRYKDKVCISGQSKDDTTPVSARKNKKVIDMRKDKIGTKIIRDYRVWCIKGKGVYAQKGRQKDRRKALQQYKKVCSR